jgi:hypothetical protein
MRYSVSDHLRIAEPGFMRRSALEVTERSAVVEEELGSFQRRIDGQPVDMAARGRLDDTAYRLAIACCEDWRDASGRDSTCSGQMEQRLDRNLQFRVGAQEDGFGESFAREAGCRLQARPE